MLSPLPRLHILILPAAENLDKTKVTGVEQVDTVQDGINNMVAGQLGQGGDAAGCRRRYVQGGH